MLKPLLQCILGAILLTACPGRAAEMTEIRFSGALTQQNSGGDLVLRQFEVLLLKSASTSFFSVLDDERDGCPWPESYGRLSAPDAPLPHLLYSYDGSLHSIPLPSLVLDLPDDAVEGAMWTSAGWTFEINQKQTIDGSTAWKVTARERRGRRQSLTVAADSEALLSASQDVFMGQGQRFELVLNRTSSKPLVSEAADQLGQLQSDLLGLQASLQRRPDTQLSELSSRQLADARSRMTELTVVARDTPLQETVLRIRRDVERQERRVAEAMKRKDLLLNKAAPKFSLNLVTNGTLASDALQGKTVVLHFWKYAEKPLSEPYGQVGYLEFLYNKRKQNGVEVVGVAMNPALQQAETLGAGRRTARKLIEFMNLSYPVGYDDGSLLRSFGDPRDAGGELPLWVIVSPQGQIAHYHGGFYEVDQQRGLKELDDVLIEQIRSTAK